MKFRQRAVVFLERFFINDAKSAHYLFAFAGHLHMAGDAQKIAVGDEPYRQPLLVDAVDDLPQMDIGQDISLAIELHQIRMILCDFFTQTLERFLDGAEVMPLTLVLGAPPGTDDTVENAGLFRLDVHRQNLPTILVHLNDVVLLVSKLYHSCPPP